MKSLETKKQSKRVVDDGKVDTWQDIGDLPVRPSRFSKVARSLIDSWSRFVNTESPTIEELEEKNGLSAGEIMAIAAKHG